jgi:hypothetical protein
MKKILLLTGLMLVWAIPGFAQTDSVDCQWSYGGEPDVSEFRLYYGTTTGSYAIGYTLPITSYTPPPAWMTLPIPLEPGDYYFVVTAVDEAGNESDYSNEAPLRVGDVIIPGPCSGLDLRIP